MENNKYKVVFILGGRLDDIGYDIKNDPVYKNENFLLIGDGINPITNDSLAVLSGRINKNTSIIISTHGSVHSLDHSVSLHNESVLTYDFLKALQQTNPNIPLNIFLESCYAGYASKDVEALNIGSTLVTFSDLKVHDNIFRSLKSFMVSLLENSLDNHPLNHFLPNLHNYIYDKFALSYVSGVKIMYLTKLQKYVGSCDIKSSTEKFIDMMHEEFESFGLCVSKAFNAEHYKEYVKQASEKLSADFNTFIGRLLIHYVQQDSITDAREIIRYCKSNSNDCDLNELINKEDKYYMYSLMDCINYLNSDGLESAILGDERNSFKTDYELFHAQHKQCFVD